MCRQPISWWFGEALESEEHAAEPIRLTADEAVDVALVGGGYTGLWTALALKDRRPSLRVAVVEAKQCGSGASGRNGGFLHGYWYDLPRLRAAFGDEGAAAIAVAGGRIVPAVRAFCKAHGEDVWLRESGHMRVALTPAHEERLGRIVDAARALGYPEQAEPLGPEAVASRCESPAFRGGVFFRDCATIQPARLARALRRAALDAGISVYENSPVVALRSGKDAAANRYVLRTPAGSIRAEDVVLATNAAAAGCKALRRRLTNFGSYAIMTEPVPDLLSQMGWTGGEALSDARVFLRYFRTTPDGRVLMGTASGPIGRGGQVGTRFDFDGPSIKRAKAGLKLLLPEVSKRTKVVGAWGGAVDIAADHFPSIGTVPDTRIHYAVGYSGHGTGPSWIAGQALASIVTSSDDQWSRLPLVNRVGLEFPPDPFKYMGGRAVRAAMLACEEAEEQGRRPPPGARAVSQLPNVLGIRLGR
jgi:glycine/D-amino acid oxidase-like deaminating enzyme